MSCQPRSKQEQEKMHPRLRAYLVIPNYEYYTQILIGIPTNKEELNFVFRLDLKALGINKVKSVAYI